MEQRIIKFKAKRLDNNEWITGDLLQMSEKDVQIYNKDCGGSDHPVNPSTVCQFTGLKDKNGKEIWEGDYLKSIYDGCKPMKVVFKCGTFCFDVCYHGLEVLPLACYDTRAGELVELEIVDRKEEK